jgi:hypothetical protein
MNLSNGRSDNLQGGAMLDRVLYSRGAQARLEEALADTPVVKEYLQIVVLDFIYSHPVYSQLLFYGGSALAHCFDLQRLSEDLDFIDETKKIKVPKLAEDLENYFAKRTDLDVKATVQKFRIYLKFPILRDLGISTREETDVLFLKVEVYSEFDFCERYTTDIRPIFKFNRSVLIKTLDPATLMGDKDQGRPFPEVGEDRQAGKDCGEGKRPGLFRPPLVPPEGDSAQPLLH